MEIKQLYDKTLAHASYAIESNGQIALVDPARDPAPYYNWAQKKGGKIIAVIETHPHADFVSSHLEVSKKTGSKIYVSKLVGADYDHIPFDTGDVIHLGAIQLKAFNTPGHSPDSISIVATDENGKDHAVFTGDTLFIGDVGRPDLHENAGNVTSRREELARKMYKSTREILMKLEKDVSVYPAHGAGSLCGKNLSDETVSTIGRELRQNYALQDMSEDEFVDLLFEDQPFIPKYFAFDVEINKTGADNFEENVKNVTRLDRNTWLEEGVAVVDTRNKESFNKGHIPGALNIIEDGKFETWLGSIISPDEVYYLIAEDETALESVITRAAKIGYEKKIKGALLNPNRGIQAHPKCNVDAFKSFPENFTIVDVRSSLELKAEKKYFENVISIPLHELRERAYEVPTQKPIVVYCAGGYRSAAGASILQNINPGIPVYDLGESIQEFQTAITVN